MGVRIFRKVTLGAADEATYGTAVTTADYVLNVEELTINEQVIMAENTAMLGSDYQLDNIRPALEYCTFTIKAKIDENSLPFLMKQKYDIVSSTVSGESAVYSHALTYNTRNASASGQSYTLLLDDGDIADLVIAGARFEKHDFTVEPKGFLMLEMTGVGKYPTNDTITNSVSAQPRDFLGRHAVFSIADYGSSYGDLGILSYAAKNQYGLSGEDDNFYLGDEGLNHLYTMSPRFDIDVTTHQSNETYKDLWQAGTKQKTKLVVTDTSRYVTGSVASTRPAVTIEYPSAKISAWKRDGGANDLGKQTMTLTALDDPSESSSPAAITIVNSIASY